MFLGELEGSHKEAFMALARRMVSADGKITPEEKQMLDDAVLELGLSAEPDFDAQLPKVKECCGAVLDPEARAFILLELASFAYVDHEYDESERELLHSVADLWRLDPLTVVRIEDWARRRVELSKEAVEVIQEIRIFNSPDGDPKS